MVDIDGNVTVFDSQVRVLQRVDDVRVPHLEVLRDEAARAACEDDLAGQRHLGHVRGGSTLIARCVVLVQ